LPTEIVPIAYFSEFRCPYCRALERDLDTLLAEDPAFFRLIQHELPIFGPASELAARASVAAARQGKQQELRRRFMRTPLVAEPASVLRVATDIGLDVDQLTRDMASPEVQAELDRTRALADIFGFIGTPGLVIGRTVLNGAIPYALLRRIAEDEKSRQTSVC
jgi:protein-disulfide isomerase